MKITTIVIGGLLAVPAYANSAVDDKLAQPAKLNAVASEPNGADGQGASAGESTAKSEPSESTSANRPVTSQQIVETLKTTGKFTTSSLTIEYNFDQFSERANCAVAFSPQSDDFVNPLWSLVFSSIVQPDGKRLWALTQKDATSGNGSSMRLKVESKRIYELKCFRGACGFVGNDPKKEPLKDVIQDIRNSEQVITDNASRDRMTFKFNTKEFPVVTEAFNHLCGD